MEKNKYKVCQCKEEFSEVRICCTGCGRSGLTANEARRGGVYQYQRVSALPV